MKKINKIITLILLIPILVIGCNKDEDKTQSEKLYTEKDVKPISKESVINILRAEYGDIIATTVDEIEPSGDYYITEVYINVKDSEEEQEQHKELGEHAHRENLGKHKINMYTGEISTEE